MTRAKEKFVINSAKVFPKQMRLPPKKGQKANELRGLPSGLKNNGDFGSNLSGLKEFGSIHSLGSL
jgi:hypothetical protein